ncbi:MAG: sugar phosphate isomerase/epimerase family protein [Lawsonibacter sp.]
MAQQFSLAYLTVPGITPVEQIKLAQEAGYQYVSLRTIPMGLPGEPQICLEQDPEQFRLIRQALQDREMKLLDIELVRIREDLPSDYLGAFERGAELGATNVLSSVWTRDHAFAVDRYGAICEQAAQFGLTVNLEFPVVSGLTTLADTVALQDKVNAPNLKLLMDMIYVHLDHVTPQDILSLDPARFGIIHLCDFPKDMDGMELVQVMREGRAYCGEGAVDLEGLLKALPSNPYSIELPNAKRIAELGAAGHAARCLATAKAYFADKGL